MDSNKQEMKFEVAVICTESSENATKLSKKSMFHINRDMLPFKVHFFLFIGAIGVTLPYMVVFAKYRIGLSTTSIALCLTVQQFLFILTKPVIGFIADYFHKLKAIIFALTILQTVFLFMLLAIPRLDQTTPDYHNSTSEWQDECYKPVQFKQFQVHQDMEEQIAAIKSSDRCSTELLLVDTTSSLKKESNYSFHQCREDSNRSCTLVTPSCIVCCNSDDSFCDAFSCSSFIDAIVTPDYKTYQYWAFAVIFTMAEVCTNALFTLSDTSACESVAKYGVDYGRQRLYGAVGWGVAAVAGGYLNDVTQNYLASWILMAIITVLALLNILRMQMVEPKFSQNILKDVGTVLTSKEYLVFAFSVFVCGMATGIIWFYLVWFLTTIGGSTFLCGLAHAMQCFVGEIPFMFFSGWLIKKLGHYNILTLALCSYCIRFMCYSYLYNPWFVLPIECLHGFTYGLFYPALATYSKLSAKPGTEATTQAISFTIHEGLGAGIGTLLAGFSIDRIGTHRTFFIASIIAGCGAIISIILHRLIGYGKAAKQ